VAGIDKVDWSSVHHSMVGRRRLAPEVSRRFTQVTGVKVVQGSGYGGRRATISNRFQR